MGASSHSSNRSTIIQLVLCFALGLTVLCSVGRYIAEPQDRSRCHGMLNDGWWLEPNYTKWQPSGCMPHTYTPQEISTCLNHSRVLYVGDSIMREQFYSMTKFVKTIHIKGGLHVDRKYVSEEYGMTYEFWWDPYINSTRTIAMLNATDPDNRPSLLVIGSGVWYMRHLDERYFDEWKVAVDRVMNAVQQSNRVADAVLLSPVEIPQFDLLNPVRREKFTMDKIKAMNNYLRVKEATLKPVTPFNVAFAWNSIAASTVNVTEDGLHYLPPVTSVQAMLALNYRCNDVVIPKDRFPMDTTCCYHYPTPAWYQNLILLFFLAWTPLGFYMISSGTRSAAVQFMRRLYPSESRVLGSLFVFGLGVAYMYFCDRTQLYGKALKSFHANQFTALMIATLIAGLVTLRSNKNEGPGSGFLSRAQTDEWKGWMQIVILVYHFLGASHTAGIYNVMRVLVAAYLFQTGYGHFFFFYKKKDFSMARVLNVMVRLNLLTFVLQYVMATNYLSYYFTPLVTFWFGVIWVVMYIGHHANHVVWFVVLKIVIMGALTGALIHAPGVLEWTFDVLAVLFNIHWDAAEWRFRLGLDAWIVYLGMLFALATIKLTESKWHEHNKHAWRIIKYALMIPVSVLSLVWYFYFELSQPSKQAYNAYHPYISWIPILAFVVLRNATARIRNTTSRFYELIGKCSLETFIGQFHMWLAADTKGLLIILSDPSWTRTPLGWWFNFCLSSVLFVFVCYHLNKTTGEITQWICTAAAPASSSTTARSAQNEEQQVPLLPTSNNTASPEDEEEQKTDEEWVASQQQQPSRWVRFWSDLRTKCILFLLFIGILNHFC